MLARFAFAIFTTALLVLPVAAKPPTSAIPGPEKQVKIEVKFVTIAEDFFERIGVNFNINRNGENVEVDKLIGGDPINSKEPIFLDEKELHKLLESLQGDIRTNFVDGFRVIVSNGKTTLLRRTHKHRSETTPSESVPLGYKVSIRPAVAADRRAVALNMKLSLTSLDTEKPLQTTTLSLVDELTIPVGHTALLGGWKRLSEGRYEYGPPVTGKKAPSGKRHIRNVCYKQSTEQVLILVTVTLVE